MAVRKGLFDLAASDHPWKRSESVNGACERGEGTLSRLWCSGSSVGDMVDQHSGSGPFLVSLECIYHHTASSGCL